mgnify:FL=1
MKRPIEIQKQLNQIGTIVNLTDVFASISSIRISRIKNQVLMSKDFFAELWGIYNQIRVGEDFNFGRGKKDKTLNKDLYIVITSEGGFSGDIDQKLIKWMLESYDPKKQDIIVVGHHGVVELAQKDIGIKRYFKMPLKDQNINVSPLIQEIIKYRSTTAWYQTYVSLMVQDIKKLNLRTAVKEQGQEVEKAKDIISEENYIFEPSTEDVVRHLERTMLQVAISQIILESKLAQYASRFEAMSQASEKAKSHYSEVLLDFNRSKRNLQDEHLKEMMAGLRGAL